MRDPNLFTEALGTTILKDRTGLAIAVTPFGVDVELDSGDVVRRLPQAGKVTAGDTVTLRYAGGGYTVLGNQTVDSAGGSSVLVAGSGGSGGGGSLTVHDLLGSYHNLPTVAQATFFAGPAGSTGTPSFRGIALSDFQTAADTRYVPLTRTLSAGNLIVASSLGSLAADRTIAVDPAKLTITAGKLDKTGAGTLALNAAGGFMLDVPASGTAALGAGTLSFSSINLFSTATHTHAITTTTAGAASTILALDGSSTTRVGGIGVISSGVIEFGYGVIGKETNAGKIGYGSFTAGSLDILGAGASSGTRKIKLWDDVEISDTLGIGIAPTHPLHIRHTSLPQIQVEYDASHTLGISVDNLGNAFFTPTGPLTKFPTSTRLQTPNYVSQLTGWAVSGLGEGDFRYLYADEMHVKKFIADIEIALAGGQIIGKSVAPLWSDFTCPAPGGIADLYVENFPGTPSMAVFETGDYVRIRTISRAGGGLVVADCWGIVDNYAQDSSGYFQYFRFVRSPFPDSGTMSTGQVVEKGSIVLDYGSSITGFGGYYEVTTVDGIYGLNSPYMQIVTWTGHPRSGVTLRTRTGALRGVFGVAGEYGLYAGDGVAETNSYIRASNQGFELRNLDLNIYDGTNLSFKVTRSVPSLALGSTAPGDYLTGNGVWMGKHGGVYKLRVGTVVSGVLTKGMTWDGSNLGVIGSAIVGNGTGFATPALMYCSYTGPARPSGASSTTVPINTNGHYGQRAVALGSPSGLISGRWGANGCLNLTSAGAALAYSALDNISPSAGSVSAWCILPTDPSGGDSCFLFQAGATWPLNGISARVISTGQMTVTAGSAGSSVSVTSSGSVPNGTWFHFGMDWSAGGTLNVYIDGSLAGTGALAITPVVANTGLLGVGYSPAFGSGSVTWRGYIQEFCTIGRQLTADEWLQIVSSNAPLVITRSNQELLLTEYGQGAVNANAGGIYGTTSGGVPNFTLLNSTQTINGESLSAGSVLFGDNSAGKANLVWDNSTGGLAVRVATSNRFSVDSSGNMAIGEVANSKSWVQIASGGVKLITRSAGGADSDQVVLDTSGVVTVGEAANNKSRLILTAGVAKFTWRNGSGTDADRVTVDASGILRLKDSAGADRIVLDGTGSLNIKNSSGTDVITFDGSGNSSFANIMSIGTSGEIRQGTGTVGVNFEGMRIYQASSKGKIEFYEAGRTGFGLSLSNTGMQMRQSTGFVGISSVYWINPGGTALSADLYSFQTGTKNELSITSRWTSGGFQGRMFLQATNSNGTTNPSITIDAQSATIPFIDLFALGNGRITIDNLGSTLYGQVNCVTGPFMIAANQVLTTRRTGWTAASGTADRTTFAQSTVTTAELAKRVKALIDDLITHGIIGA